MAGSPTNSEIIWPIFRGYREAEILNLERYEIDPSPFLPSQLAVLLSTGCSVANAPTGMVGEGKGGNINSLNINRPTVLLINHICGYNNL